MFSSLTAFPVDNREVKTVCAMLALFGKPTKMQNFNYQCYSFLNISTKALILWEVKRIIFIKSSLNTHYMPNTGQTQGQEGWAMELWS